MLHHKALLLKANCEPATAVFLTEILLGKQYLNEQIQCCVYASKPSTFSLNEL
jgi:hypothetical protein